MTPLLLALLLSAAPVAPAPPLPGDGAVAGWSRAGAVKRFRGAELYGFINGGSEIFLEVGFEELLVQDYRRGEDELSLELYRMSDDGAALAIYLARCGEERRDPGLTDRHSLNPYQLLLRRGASLVQVGSATGREALVPAMVALARAAAAELPPGREGDLSARLPGGFLPGSVRLLRGGYGLGSIITLGEGDMLRLGGRLTAVAAEYPGEGGRRTLVVADYPSEADAEATFDHVRTHLDPYLQPLAADPALLVFKDHAGRYGRLQRTGARLELEVNLGAPPL